MADFRHWMWKRLQPRIWATASGAGRIGRHVASILEHEPSWFAEFGSALGLLLWAKGAFLTDDLAITGWLWAAPCIALVGSPIRWWLLWKTWYGWRVLAAVLSALFWGWLIMAIAGRYGEVPLASGPQSWFVMDCLTMARFSLPCLRDILAERRERQTRG